jgi:hypothetical protein
MNTHTLEEARAAKTRALVVFRELAPVVGVGITTIDDGYGVRVNLREAPAPGVELPEHIDGVPVQVRIVGQVSAVLPKRTQPE